MKAHIEVEHGRSMYSHAIPILLPCFAMLLTWNQEQHDLSVTIHHRINNRLAKVIYPVNNYSDNVPRLDQIRSMPVDQRQNFVRDCLEMPKELLQRWDNIPLEYHF